MNITAYKRASVQKRYINFYGFGGRTKHMVQVFDSKDGFALDKLGLDGKGWCGIRICTEWASNSEKKKAQHGEATDGIIQDGLYLTFCKTESIDVLIEMLHNAKKHLKNNIADAEREERRRAHEEYLQKFGGKVINLMEWKAAHLAPAAETSKGTSLVFGEQARSPYATP